MSPADARREPLVSVLLPVYNGAKTVERAIESIRAQTLVDWELIAYDDASTDSSAQILDVAAQSDNRIRLLRADVNRGLGHAMNELCAAARGAYCAVQEQDDRSLPSRLALQTELLASRPDVGVVAGISSLRGWDWTETGTSPQLLVDGGQYPSDRADLVRYLYLNGCQVDNAGAMFRREVVSAGIGFDEQAHSSADWQFYLDVAHRWRFHGLHQVLVEMDRGPEHAHITADRDQMFAAMRRCVDIVHQRYGDDPTSPIDGALRRRALSNVAVKQARARGVRAGAPQLLLALRLNRANGRAWRLAMSWAGAALRYPVRSPSYRRRCMDLSVRPGSRIATLPAPLRPPAVAARAGYSTYRRFRNRPKRPPYVFRDDGLATAHLSPAQIDPSFVARYERIRERCWPDVPWDISWRLWLLARLAQTAAPLAGSFAEFGSFRGGCAYMVLSSLDLRPEQKLYLFDTFTGIPTDALTPSERADRFADRYQDTSPEMVRELLAPWSDAVELVVGDVRQTVLEVETGPLALAQLDMNAAAPTLPALDYVWSRLVPHGVVVFDDYGYGVTEYKDQRLLIDSFFASHSGQVVELPTGQAFVTKPA